MYPLVCITMPYKKRTRRGGKGEAKIARIAKKVMARNVETKFIDIPISGTASTTGLYGVDFITAALYSVGAGSNNRIGNKIKVLGARYMLEVNPGDNFNVYRLLMIKRSDCELISTSIVLSSLLGAVDTHQCSVVRDIIQQVRFAPVAGSTSDTVGLRKFYKGYVKLNRTIEFTGALNTPTRGCTLGLQFHSDSALVPHPGLTGYVRVYYKDA